jgi:agmatinase
MQYREGVPHTFMGIENVPLDEAEVVILPVPYEATTSYKAGTRSGPDMLIRSSCQTEVFDHELKVSTVDHVKIHTAPKLQSNLSSPDAMVDDVYKAARALLSKGKYLVTIGGEHSITAGLCRAFAERHKKLTVLQIDAHADMRDEYEGTKNNHACVMRRVRELGVNVVQVGIRSYSEEEYAEMKTQKNIFYAPFIQGQVKEILAACTQEVYLTIDADGFDPSVIRATGTPVPGGLLWYEALGLLREIFKKKDVVGFDFVELADIGSMDTSSADAAAILVYRMLGYRFGKHGK